MCYVVFWGNRGLCGAYNQVLLRHLEQLVHAETRPCSVIVCGRWGRDVLAGTDLPVREICAGLSDTPTMAEALEIAETLKNLYRTGEADEIRKFMQTWDLSPENASRDIFTPEQQLQIDLDNPLGMQPDPQLTLNGQPLQLSHGCTVCHNPCLPGSFRSPEAERMLRHYGLDGEDRCRRGAH